MHAEQDRRLRFDVADTGIGIKPENLPRLCDECFREKRAETRELKGNGLGFSIVKRLVEHAGRRLDAASVDGEGSTISVLLPACPGAAARGSLPRPAAAPHGLCSRPPSSASLRPVLGETVDAARPVGDTALHGDVVPSVEDQLDEALTLGRVEQARELLERAAVGADASGLARLGTVCRSHGRFAEASDLYRHALALDPEQPHARQGVAWLLCLQGNAAAAVPRLSELVAAHPDSVPLRAMLGDVHCDLGDYGAALACYEHVLDGHPEHLGCRLGLARCLSRRPLLALRMRSPRHVLESLEVEEVDPDLLARGAAALLRASPSPLEDPLLLPVLRYALLTDLGIERALTQARRELCLSPPGDAPELAGALTDQCRLNEFAWPVGPEEEARLASAPEWVRAMYGPEGVAPEIVERSRRIPTLTPISGGISAEVRGLYEANPYPLWRRFSRGAPMDLDQHLRLLTGGEWDPLGFLKRPRLLVAGCGTGRELLSAAWTWRPATVTGFDLSRTSLAYAQQMAEGLGIEVELYHADLIELDGWERQFDAIMCAGVLHHLEDPLAGWRRLLELLRPGGVMVVGLYSETARRAIVAAQDEVRAMGVPPTPAGIRAARARLGSLPHDHPAAGCAVLRDFYHTSGCRDMLFHVQEHRFTVPRIAAALDELGLTFLAFETDGAVRHLYRTLFGAGMNLAYWDKLEQLYPETFLGMYQFWCRKGDR